MAQRQGFVCREQPPAALIQKPQRLLIPRPEVVNVDHPSGLPQPARARSADLHLDPGLNSHI
jgi:hypothetical protein